MASNTVLDKLEATSKISDCSYCHQQKASKMEESSPSNSSFAACLCCFGCGIIGVVIPLFCRRGEYGDSTCSQCNQQVPHKTRNRRARLSKVQVSPPANRRSQYATTPQLAMAHISSDTHQESHMHTTSLESGTVPAEASIEWKAELDSESPRAMTLVGESPTTSPHSDPSVVNHVTTTNHKVEMGSIAVSPQTPSMEKAGMSSGTMTSEVSGYEGATGTMVSEVSIDDKLVMSTGTMTSDVSRD